MGVLNGRDLFSSKWITAEIKDSARRLHYVPIKHTIGDYFITKIDGQLYCFKIDGEICQYRENMVKAFSVIQYDIKHYRPMKSEIKELELALDKNSLPKVDINLSEILRILGAREKSRESVPHDIAEIINLIEDYKKSKISKIIPKNQEKFARLSNSMLNYLNNLDVSEIVTPMRSISNFIEDDLKATDPQFLGTIATTLQNLDYEDKKVTNVPITAKKAWMKMLLIMMGVAVVGMVLYLAMSSGAFDGMMKFGDSFGAVGDFFKTQGGAGTRPPTAGTSGLPPECQGAPEACKQAVDIGAVKITELPESMRKIIESMPSIAPKNTKVELTP